ncbi:MULTISPECIES: PadR family transcriptional regulator [unclassified Mycobacterium]|uniref:PadR family transcriptional regulator n=1 Tax=unclassified Mycobacterium TaxID=2642494 RepID=UPI00080155D4|nr:MULTISPECIES: PadR family transcriptional regulator [unclassified Mycobacterium]OBG67099.1 PadR family transcriptional regulator [Mycobacterium sp. E735]OBG80954.1 PadR family transcriptional regulator [Mycobacterium sp. E3305]OBG91472.1 PadR family transcriptional regulator [Mycobacterium sp. E3251]OBI37221.1 PadR family transcriptional regulator [Mycobacterium sp. E1386]
MASKPTTTSFALLGLLGIRSWTAYEIVAQIKRGVHFFWPRSEAHLYAELKRLVERGHASAETVEGRRRQRTRYTITPEGRAALEDWFGTQPAVPVVEAEGFLRLFLGDQATKHDLRESLEATAREAREMHAKGKALIEELLHTGGPFPERLHLVEPEATFIAEFYRNVIAWCEQTIAEIEEWPDTRDVGLTARGRQRWQRILAQPDP